MITSSSEIIDHDFKDVKGDGVHKNGERWNTLEIEENAVKGGVFKMTKKS